VPDSMADFESKDLLVYNMSPVDCSRLHGECSLVRVHHPSVKALLENGSQDYNLPNTQPHRATGGT
jgi:hypothetical protein